MAINLQKGQRIEIGLSKISLGLGWNPHEGTGFDFDLDASWAVRHVGHAAQNFDDHAPCLHGALRAAGGP